MITYCTNIHPGESWAETFDALSRHLPAIKSEFSPVEPFPVGLRLSARAVRELDAVATDRFTEWLCRHDLFVPTINGFPYGSFHAARVKEQVYLPDWRQSERVDYTTGIATLLDRWLPDFATGSISTVPLRFGRDLPREELAVIRENILRTMEHLDRLRQCSGKGIILALEPEPGCLLETTDDVISFLQRMEFPDSLRSTVGICLDCCHQAVEFESPKEVMGALAAAGIPVVKVQISSALRMFDPDPATLAGFCEPSYLHQTVIRDAGGKLRRYDDLPQALRLHPTGEGNEWRVHFHLPIFVEQMPGYGTTRDFITALLPSLEGTELLEVETYTWEVLPPELRTSSVDASIVRELQWLKGAWDATNRRS